MTQSGEAAKNAVLPSPPSASRFAHIDAMRAVAVLLVVVGHAGLGHLIPGGSGVTIFFGISGFIITTLLLKERRKTSRFEIGGFYTRRLVKLMPPLVVVLVIPTFIYAAFGGVINWNAFAGQVFFYFNWFKLDHPDVFPGSAVVWSLSIEEQFYIVFAILWLCLVRSSRAIPWLAGLAMVVIVTSTTLRFALADPGNGVVADRIYYGSDTRADSLAWGILAAIILYKWQKSDAPASLMQRVSGSQWALIGAVLVFLVSLVIRDDWFRQTIRYSLQSITTCVVVIYGFTAASGLVQRGFASVCQLRILQITGLASYSIYLVHLSIIVTIDDYTKPLSLPIHVLVGTALSVGVGVAIFKRIELPARALYDRVRGQQGRHRASSSRVKV